MARVYKLKHKVKIENLKDLGYEQLPGEIAGQDIIAYLPIEVSEDSDLVTALISIYNNQGWQANFAFDDDSRNFYKDMVGIEFEKVFDEDGKEKYVVSETEDIRKILSKDYWRIEVNFKDKQLALTAGVRDELPAFYNKKILDQYASDDIDKLFENGYLTVIDIKE